MARCKLAAGAMRVLMQVGCDRGGRGLALEVEGEFLSGKVARQFFANGDLTDLIFRHTLRACIKEETLEMTGECFTVKTKTPLVGNTG